MKIEAGSAANAPSAPTRAQGQAGVGFEPAASGAKDVAPQGPTVALNAAASLDALLALQEAPGAVERRRRAVKRAGKLLDILDSLKLSLLEGGAGSSTLTALQGAVRESRAGTDDPKLEGVLDEIETRAAVELAKQEMNRSPTAHAA